MDFRETDRVETSDVATAELTRTEAETPVESTAGVKAKLNGDVEPTVPARRFALETDASRDALLTDFGKATLQDRHLLPGASSQDLFARVAAAYHDYDDLHPRLIHHNSTQNTHDGRVR